MGPEMSEAEKRRGEVSDAMELVGDEVGVEVGRGSDGLHDVTVGKHDTDGIADETCAGDLFEIHHVMFGVPWRVHHIDRPPAAEGDLVAVLEDDEALRGDRFHRAPHVPHAIFAVDPGR